MYKLSIGAIKDMQVEHIAAFKRRPTLNSTGYLYDSIILSVDAILHPSVIAYTIAGGVPKAGNEVGPKTWAGLRDYLLQPRHRVIFKLTTPGVETTILEAPDVGKVCDVTGGPRTIQCEVTEAVGVKAWFVRLTLQIDVNQYEGRTGKTPSPLLSNEFGQESFLDNHCFEERHTKGVVVFRRDLLEKLKAVPDDYRLWFMGHPIPVGFQRVGVNVRQHEDGITFDYEIIDRQQYVSWDFHDIAEIQMEVGTGHEAPSGGAVLGGAISVGATAYESATDPLWGGITEKQRKRRAIGRTLGTAISVSDRLLPTHYYSYVIRTFGTPTCTRDHIIEVTERLSLYLFDKLRFGRVLGVDADSKNFQVHTDLMRPVCIVEFRGQTGIFRSGPWARQRLLADPTYGGNFKFPAKGFPNLYPKVRGIRGTAKEALVAAMLHDTGEAPPVADDQHRKLTERLP